MFIMFFQLIAKSYPGPVGLKSRILTNIHCILYCMKQLPPAKTGICLPSLGQSFCHCRWSRCPGHKKAQYDAKRKRQQDHVHCAISVCKSWESSGKQHRRAVKNIENQGMFARRVAVHMGHDCKQQHLKFNKLHTIREEVQSAFKQQPVQFNWFHLFPMLCSSLLYVMRNKSAIP